MKNPCKKDCPGRSATCHAECDDYLAFNEHNMKRNLKRRQESEIFDYVNKEVAKSMRGKQR